MQYDRYAIFMMYVNLVCAYEYLYIHFYVYIHVELSVLPSSLLLSVFCNCSSCPRWYNFFPLTAAALIYWPQPWFYN